MTYTVTTSPRNGVRSIDQAFAVAKQRGEGALIPYICGGYPTADDTINILLAMQYGGADIIELGVPCDDPFKDGPTIRNCHRLAMDNGTKGIRDCLNIVKTARSKGLTVPIILMGYYSFFEKEYDLDLHQMCYESSQSGVDGFLPVGIQEGTQEIEFNEICYKYNLSNIQLVIPGSSEQRINDLTSMASTFLYVISVKGKTGARESLPDDLDSNVARVRSMTDLPVVVGFGISSPKMVHDVSNICDGAVVGSFLTDCLNQKGVNETYRDVMYDQVSCLHSGTKQTYGAKYQASRYSSVPLHIAMKQVSGSDTKKMDHAEYQARFAVSVPDQQKFPGAA